MKKCAICFLSFVILFSIIAMLSAFGVSFLDTDRLICNATDAPGRGFAASGSTDTVEVLSDSDSNLSEDFSKLYFSNLNVGYYGYNDFNSCGYVGLGMLLSYYDTFWNDNVIAEQYDNTVEISSVNCSDITASPGTKEMRPTADYFGTYVSEYNNTYFNARLLKIALDLGYNLETRFYQIKDILDKYFELHSSLSTTAFSIVYVNHEWDYKDNVPNKDIKYHEQLISEVISYVKKGVPVLVGLSGEIKNEEQEDPEHIAIAYDYNSNTDTLYGHFGQYGYGNATKHKDMESESYKYVSAYIALVPRVSHVHSDNYTLNGEGVCSCQLSNHKHEYKEYSIKLNDDQMHYEKCYCGKSVLGSHSFRVVGKNYVCSLCHYTKPYDGKFYPIIITPNNVVDDIKALGIEFEEV